eukprot:CAMPEP_0170500940 /NCGR_PEP_ID=MMETSP0208-20121228/36610_1 /TAXON_ID=197538 /ORGANISM="Strombidium inclinatum, Strain S3" /LENGTH=55 /DNA_ID=CAMNT_0010779225 /DNA_START=126 /DNA_END=290 /DNA_ORIENTATION=+
MIRGSTISELDYDGKFCIDYCDETYKYAAMGGTMKVKMTCDDGGGILTTVLVVGG